MATFTDVPETQSLYPSVEWVASQAVMPGVTATTFGPRDLITRVTVAETLYRLAGNPHHVPPTTSPFPDVATTHASYRQIHWAWQRDLMRTWADRTFRPTGYFPREKSAETLYRTAGSPAYTAPTTSPFADVATTRGNYKAICWMYSLGLTTGSVVSGKRYFEPIKNNPRDHWAAFLHRFDTKV